MIKRVFIVSVLIIALTAAGAFAEKKSEVSVKQGSEPGTETSVLLLAGLAHSAFAEKKSELNVKQGSEPGTEIAALLLARGLAQYGYRNESPESLVVAAGILADNPPGELKPEEEEILMEL